MERQYRARKYRYANGIAYRPNLYHLHLLDDDNIHTKVILGGMIVLKDKVFAYVGSPTAVQEKVGDIIKSSHTSSYVWANDMKSALQKIKPFLDNEQN